MHLPNRNAIDSLTNWRWAPCVGLASGAALFVVLASSIIPERIGGGALPAGARVASRLGSSPAALAAPGAGVAEAEPELGSTSGSRRQRHEASRASEPREPAPVQGFFQADAPAPLPPPLPEIPPPAEPVAAPVPTEVVVPVTPEPPPPPPTAAATDLPPQPVTAAEANAIP